MRRACLEEAPVPAVVDDLRADVFGRAVVFGDAVEFEFYTAFEDVQCLG